MAWHYAQINNDGYVVCDSHLSGEVEAENMILVPDDFDLTNKRYVNGEWEEYEPEPIPDLPEPEPYVPEPTPEEVFQAEVLLSQAEIHTKLDDQEVAIAEILLSQAELQTQLLS